MIGHVERQQRLAVAIDALVLGDDLHAVAGRRGASGGEAAPAVDLDQAGAAGAGRIEPGVVAERRDDDVLARRDIEDGFARREGILAAR